MFRSLLWECARTHTQVSCHTNVMESQTDGQKNFSVVFIGPLCLQRESPLHILRHVTNSTLDSISLSSCKVGAHGRACRWIEGEGETREREREGETVKGIGRSSNCHGAFCPVKRSREAGLSEF